MLQNFNVFLILIPARTRSVDVTVTNILEGRVNIVTRRPPHNENLITQTYTSLPSSKKSRAFTIQDCNRTFHERKKDLIEQARRCVCVCLSVCLSVCLFVCPSVCRACVHVHNNYIIAIILQL